MHDLAHVGDLVSRWCLFLIVILIPIFVVPVSWITVSQAKALFIAIVALVALVMWLIARFTTGVVRIPRHILLWGGALLPIAYLISAGASGNVWSSLVSGEAATDTAVTVCIWYILLALTALVFSNSASSITKFLRALLIGLFVLMTFQTIRIFAPGLTSLGGYLSGNTSSILGSWHDLGIIAGLSIFFVFTLWDTAVASNWWRALLTLLCVASLFILIIINTTDVWFALATFSLLFFVWYAYRMWREGMSILGAFFRRTALMWISLSIFCGASGYLSPIIYAHLPSTLQIAQLEVRPSWQGTYLVGQKALSGPRALLIGSGPNTFTRDWGLFKPADVNLTNYWNIDFNAGVGFIPTTFVTTGALALFAWAVVVLGLLLSALSLVRMHGVASTDGIRAAVVGGTLYIMAFQIMYVPGVALSALLFLFIGLIVALEVREPLREPLSIQVGTGSVLGISSSIIALLLVALFALAPITAVRAMYSNVLIQRAASLYRSTGNLDQTSSLVQNALSVFPENDLAQRAAVEVGLLKLSQLVQANKTDEAAKAQLQAQLQDIISHGLSAVSIDSADYQNWLSLAVIYQNLAGVGIEGAYENAKSAYDRTITENPTSPLPHLQLAQLALAQKDSATALREVNKALALKSNFGAAYFLRSQIEAGAASYPQAIQDAVNASQLAPQDPIGWYNLGAIYYAAGSYNLASQALGQAVSLQNNYANAMFLLGLTWDKLGRSPDALNVMEAVAQLNPTDASVQQIVANLKAGKPALTNPAQKNPTPAKKSRAR